MLRLGALKFSLDVNILWTIFPKIGQNFIQFSGHTDCHLLSMVGSVLKQKALKERNGNCASKNERLHGHTKSICIADYFNSSLQAKEL